MSLRKSLVPLHVLLFLLVVVVWARRSHAALTPSRADVKFGRVLLSTEVTREVSVTASSATTFTSVTLTGTDAAVFSFPTAPDTSALGAGETRTWTVAVTATGESSFSAELTVNSSDDPLSVPLTATGVPAGPFAALREPAVVRCNDAGGNAVELEVAKHRWMVDGIFSFDTRAYFVDGEPMVPGPSIVMTPGEACTVTVVNSLEGEACADGSNHNEFHCSETTNLHTHGLHVSSWEDRIDSHIDPGESRDYSYTIPDDHLQGTFWYHAHRHGSTSLQVLGGLHGALFMEPTDGYTLPADLAALYEGTGTSSTLVLSHLAFGGTMGSGAFEFDDYPTISSQFSSPAVTFAPNASPSTPSPSSFYVVNGQYQPAIDIVAGQYHLLRIVNGGGIQVLELSYSGSAASDCTFTVLSRDGVFQATPYLTPDSLVFPAGGRVDVAVFCSASQAGNTVDIEAGGTTATAAQIGTDNHITQSIVWRFNVLASNDGRDVVTTAPSSAAPLPTYLDSLASATVTAHDTANIQLAASSINGDSFPGFNTTYVDGSLCYDRVYEFTLGAAAAGGGPGGGPGGPGRKRLSHLRRLLQGGPTSAHPYHQHIKHLQIVDTADSSGSILRENEFRDVAFQFGADGVTFRFSTTYSFPKILDHDAKTVWDEIMVLHCHWLPHEDEGMMGLMRIRMCDSYAVFNVSDHDFGTVGQGTHQLTLSVSNYGESSLDLGDLALGGDSADFAISGDTSTALAAQASRDITITYSPASAGSVEATLSLGDAKLTMTAEAAFVASLSSSPVSVDIDVQRADVPHTITLTISNDGGEDATISSVAVGGADAALFSAGTLTSLTAGSTTSLNVTFDDTSSNVADNADAVAELTITYTSASITGNAELDVSLTVTMLPTPPASLSSSPVSVDVDVQRADVPHTITLTISNTGEEDATISSVAVGGTDAALFTAGALTTLAASGSTSLDIVFDDTSSNVAENADAVAELTITYTSASITGNAELDVSLTVTMLPTAPASLSSSPASVDVDVQRADVPHTITLTISNTGDEDATISSVAVGGTDAALFTAGALTTLAASGSTSLDIVFDDSSSNVADNADAVAELTVTYTSTGITGSELLTVPLTVTMLPTAPASLSSSPTSVDIDVQRSEVPRTISLTISNTGEEDATISSVAVGGTDAALFTAGALTTLAASGSTSLDIVFDDSSSNVAENADAVAELTVTYTSAGITGSELLTVPLTVTMQEANTADSSSSAVDTTVVIASSSGAAVLLLAAAAFCLCRGKGKATGKEGESGTEMTSN